MFERTRREEQFRQLGFQEDDASTLARRNWVHHDPVDYVKELLKIVKQQIPAHDWSDPHWVVITLLGHGNRGQERECAKRFGVTHIEGLPLDDVYPPSPKREPNAAWIIKDLLLEKSGKKRGMKFTERPPANKDNRLINRFKKSRTDNRYLW